MQSKHSSELQIIRITFQKQVESYFFDKFKYLSNKILIRQLIIHKHNSKGQM